MPLAGRVCSHPLLCLTGQSQHREEERGSAVRGFQLWGGSEAADWIFILRMLPRVMLTRACLAWGLPEPSRQRGWQGSLVDISFMDEETEALGVLGFS